MHKFPYYVKEAKRKNNHVIDCMSKEKIERLNNAINRGQKQFHFFLSELRKKEVSVKKNLH